MALFAYLSALQSWILFKIDSMALFRASKVSGRALVRSEIFCDHVRGGAVKRPPTSEVINLGRFVASWADTALSTSPSLSVVARNRVL
jgi:hypothetical protein